jgi:hypothetical protein
VTFQELAKKRVFNIPVLYWALAAVIVLAIVAWRMKPTVGVEDPATDPATADGLNDPLTADYDGLLPSGTVVVQPQNPTPADPVQQTNELWGTGAVKFLIDEDVNPGDAQQAINLYLSGNELSFEQGSLRDRAIKKLGPPPEPLQTVGTVKPKAARKQVQNFPGYHTVEGESDNTYAEIAMLEWGNGDAAHVNKISSQNTSLGGPSVVLKVGTRVLVPAYVFKTYTTTKDKMSSYNVAQSYDGTGGVAAINIEHLNPGMSFPVAKGTKVRVE